MSDTGPTFQGQAMVSTLTLTPDEHTRLVTLMHAIAKTTGDDAEAALADRITAALATEDTRDEQIRQMSIELAARQRDLVTIHEATDDIATWAEARGWQPDDAWVAKVADIAHIADPDGWADGTAELAWEAQAEAPVGDAPPACGEATSPIVTLPGTEVTPAVWDLEMTFASGVVAHREVHALYQLGAAILDTRNVMLGEGDITRIVIT